MVSEVNVKKRRGGGRGFTCCISGAGFTFTYKIRAGTLVEVDVALKEHQCEHQLLTDYVETSCRWDGEQL